MGFTPSLLKNRMTECCSLLVHVAHGATIVLHSCILLPHVSHSSNLSITFVNLQDNRAVFQIFITLLKFSFDSTLYQIITFEVLTVVLMKTEVFCSVMLWLPTFQMSVMPLTSVQDE
jgi:hypothetical protein